MSEPQPAASGPRILLIVVLVVVLLGVPALLLVGTGVVGILAAIAIPNFVTMQYKAKRAEVPANVSGLRSAELAYDAAFDAFVPAASEAEALEELTEEPHYWTGGEGFSTLGWSPDGPVRGAYWVEVRSGGFEVHGIVDVDGDGEYAEYVATESEPAHAVTPGDVY